MTPALEVDDAEVDGATRVNGREQRRREDVSREQERVVRARARVGGGAREQAVVECVRLQRRALVELYEEPYERGVRAARKLGRGDLGRLTVVALFNQRPRKVEAHLFVVE